MKTEVFDVCDERDEIIGQKTRQEVHRLGLRHRAVHVLVFNARGEMFLQKRSMQKDCFPGKWDSSASGHLDCGEDYDACAVRELREELGFEAASPPWRLFKICELLTRTLRLHSGKSTPSFRSARSYPGYQTFRGSPSVRVNSQAESIRFFMSYSGRQPSNSFAFVLSSQVE